MLTIQTWLDGYIFYEKMVKELERKKHEALQDAIRITSCPKSAAVQQSRGNSTENRNVRYIDKIDRLNAQIIEMQEYMNAVDSAVATVKTGKYRMLLQLKYIEGESWEDVAEALDMSVKWVRGELHDRALRKIFYAAKDFIPAYCKYK